MALINITPIQDGTTAQASQVNTPLQTIVDEFNGNISSVNLANGAVTTNKLGDGAVTPDKRSGGFYAIRHEFANSTGSQTITGVPFRPKYMRATYAPNSGGGTAEGGSGFAVDTGSGIEQGGNAFREGQESLASGTYSMVNISGSGGFLTEIEVTAFNSDGITVNIETLGSAVARFRQFHIEFYA